MSAIRAMMTAFVQERPIMDATDDKILRILRKDGRITHQALAERVGMSASTCQRRVEAMERQGIIAGYAPDQANWKIANTFPNGGGNWGGSYLTIPADGANVEEAQKLADWLSAPEQQVEAFVNVGAFPSQVDAYENADLTAFVNDYFGGAKTGEIGAARAEAVTVQPYKSADYFKYHDALQNAVNRVFDGSESEDAAWDTWVAEVEAL